MSETWSLSFEIPPKVPLLLQIPQACEFLEIDPILAPWGRGLVGQQGFEPYKRHLKPRNADQDSVAPALVKGDPVYACEYLYLHGFPSDLDYDVRLEKILGFELEGFEPELVEHIHEAPCVFATDSHKDVQVPSITREAVDAHGIPADDNILNPVAFE